MFNILLPPRKQRVNSSCHARHLLKGNALEFNVISSLLEEINKKRVNF